MNIEKIIPLDHELVNIFGVNDKNLKFLKTNFKKAKINVKGNVVYISGDDKTTSEILQILDEMLRTQNYFSHSHGMAIGKSVAQKKIFNMNVASIRFIP